MTVEQKSRGNRRTAFSRIGDPRVGVADSLAEHDGDHEQAEDGHASRAAALQWTDGDRVAVRRNERNGQRERYAAEQQARLRTPCAGTKPALHEERDGG